MVKDSAEVIKDFNEIVNMSAKELKDWAGTEESKGAGWTGDNDGGETVGHDSAMKIIKILESNPEKEEDKYTDEQVQHMRKVVAYCKRHLAQESHMVDEKSEQELQKTKSYKSLKNWGHDPLKVKHSNGSSSSGKKDGPETGDKRKADATKDKAQEPDAKKSKDNPKEEEDDEEEEEEDEEDEGDDDDDDGEDDDNYEEGDEEEEEEEEEEGEEEK